MAKKKAKKAPKKDMYVVKLAFDQYADFARWLTAVDDSGTRRYKRPPGLLSAEIEALLEGYKATVHEYCDPKAPTREFGKDGKGKDWNRDRILAHSDSRSPAANVTNMAMPDEICLDAKGNIDLTYLIEYVEDLCNAPREDAAWALLGMYFLSRCK